MRITFVLPYAGLAGGIRVAAIYAKKLTERGHDVTVISQPAKKASLRKKAKLAFKGKTRLKSPGKTPLLDFLGDRHLILDKRRPIMDSDVPDGDVIIATWWETAEWVAALDKSKGEKFYLLQDYEVFPHLPMQRVIDTYTLPLRKIAVSNYISNMLLVKHKLENVCVIHNAVDSAQFSSPPRLKNKDFTVGFMYSPVIRKNIELALSAIKQAKKRNDNIKVLAFGAHDPNSNHNIPNWIEYHKQPDQVVIPEIYAKCDVWLFTSDSEGFGLPLLEAMACRTPVIATRAGAASELIDEQNGCLVDANVEALIGKIETFMEMDANVWLSYSQHAYDTARSYTWDDATDMFENEIRNFSSN